MLDHLLPPADDAAPAWLRARRAEAADRLAGAELPSADAEEWRYSRIADLDPAAYHPPAPGAAAPTLEGMAGAVAALPEQAGVVLLRNGRPVRVELDERWVAKGVALLPAADLAEGGDLVGGVAETPPDVFGVLNEAAAEPIVLQVPAGVVVTDPVVVVDWIDEEGVAVASRLVVDVGEDAEVRVVEWQDGTGVDALSVPVTELRAGRAARLTYAAVQLRGSRTTQLGWQVARADADATVRVQQVGLGGAYARNRIDCRLVGRGASGELDAVYFGEGHQMLDYRTFQDHEAPDTTSDLLFAGVVAEHSRSVYTGLIHVGKGARGTNAHQANRNLKLDDGAWAESVPNLEIENNDVRCSHASTVGPIDEDQRFYLESRGVPTAVAERLIVGGFFAEVLGRLAVPAVVPLVRRELEDRLDRRLAADEGEAPS